MYDALKLRMLSRVKIDRSTGCWNWTGRKSSSGYGALGAMGKRHMAHRLFYAIQVAEIPIGMQVLHRCDNRPCINPKHLFLGTHSDNMADKKAKNRQWRNPGQLNGRAKLTEADIEVIRSSSGVRQRDLAEKFGVAQSLICMIRSGQRWGHIKEKDSFLNE
jgi:hypothetical protein